MDTKSEGVTAQVGLFFGRSNPEIQLTGALAEEFAQRVRGALGGEPVNAAPPARLGFYYGFFVRLSGELERQLGFPAEISVFQGVVTAGAGAQRKHWRDGGDLVRFLMDHAFAQGHGELLGKAGVTRPQYA